MSDKFFFNGRQKANQDHTGYGFQTRAVSKGGTKKYPLALVVTSEERQKEVEALVSGADLHAEVTVDNTDGAIESIAELTALLNKGLTVNADKTPARNDRCSCGSGKKYKKCCG